MTKIFLDSGDPKETHEARRLFFGLGSLDGQTTNPTLIARNQDLKSNVEKNGQNTSKEIEAYATYLEIVEAISKIIPQGSVSVEVYSDLETLHTAMLRDAFKMFEWAPNVHIKLPITSNGLRAAEAAIMAGLRVNMTLCFTQEQAAAVYAATRGANRGQVFISPFVGRWDDIGVNGMDLVENILKMYRQGDGHVQVLTASVRSIEHLTAAFEMGSDIVTAPLKLLKEWAKAGMPKNPEDIYVPFHLDPIPYQEMDLNRNWKEYNIQHRLTANGLKKFAADWNQLIK